MHTRRSIVTIAVSVLMLAAFVQPAGATDGGSASMLQTSCDNPPALMAVDDVAAGMTGKAYTTMSGRAISEFDVEVLGVLPGAVYPLIDLILIEVSGPAVEAVGGIAAGFSGSPVYIDGKLIGAIAYGFYGNSYIGGVTPAELMVQLGSFPATPAPQMNSASRQALDLIEAAVGSPLGVPRPLPTPVGVTGSDEWVEKLQTRANDMGLPITVFPGTGSSGGGTTSGSPGVILPGESLSAVLSEGDNSAYGTGTATYCDGTTVIGFGHPLLWTGEVTMSMNEADVVTVMQNSTGFGNFKLVTLGEQAGRVDFDGNAGIRGISGENAQAVPITSSVEFAEYGVTRDGRTLAYLTDSLYYSLGWATAGHLVTNLDAVSGTGFRPGTSTVDWVVSGTRQDKSPFTAAFDNLYWDSFSITDNSIYELASFIDILVFNPFEDVAITSVDIGDAQLFTDRRTIDITKVSSWTTSNPEPVQEYGFMQAMPGDIVTVEVTLRPFGQPGEVVETLELEVPADFEGGYGSLWLHGGSSDYLYYDPYYGDYLPGGVTDFDELLSYVEGRNRNSDLVAELTLYPSYVDGGEVPGNGLPEPPDGFIQANGYVDPVATRVKDVVEFDAVVRGERYFDLEVLPEVPPVMGTLSADLAGDNETAGGDPDGTGTAVVTFEGDMVTFEITLEGVDEPITGAHIHSGAAGEDGPVVLDLEFDVNGLSGVVFADQYLLQEMLAVPEYFYVNVHTEAYPDGAVRGQLAYEQAGEGSSLVNVSAGGLWQVEGNEPFYFGVPGDIPFMGDWDGDGIKTPGLYRASDGFAYLRNTNDTGIADLSFYMGVAGDIPIVGDWDGDGIDTFGVYRPTEGKVYLRNSNGTGATDVEYYFGVPGDVPFTGDFDGNGITDLGLHRTTVGYVYLRLTHTTGPADVAFYWGVSGDRVLAGDWNGDRVDTVGLIRPSTGMFYYRNTNATGIAEGEWPLSSTGGWTIVK